MRRKPSASFTTLPALLKKSSLSPLFNSTLFVKKSRHYDVSEAYALLQESKVVEEEYVFSKEIISSHVAYSACAREELIVRRYDDKQA